jgi:hypothetical protein
MKKFNPLRLENVVKKRYIVKPDNDQIKEKNKIFATEEVNIRFNTNIGRDKNILEIGKYSETPKLSSFQVLREPSNSKAALIG